jgi:outer membrane lipoprotein-sorting protein
MKAKVILNLLIVGLFSSAVVAQSKSQVLLDKVSDQMAKHSNSKVEFTYKLDNTEADVHQQTNGTVVIEGNKYKLNLFETTQINDGQKVYTIIPENEEVIIEPFVEENTEITPSKMLTFYKNGYSYIWDSLKTIGKKKVQYIKLIPDQISEATEVLLGIDLGSNQIFEIVQKNNRRKLHNNSG